MTYQQLEKQWRSGKADSVYLFYGEEEFLRTELIRKAIDLFLPDASLRSFNLDQFDGAESRLVDVLASAKAYPVMAEARVIICRNFEKFFVRRGKTDDADSPKNALIADYLEDPNRSTLLILDSTKPGAKNTHPWKGLFINATPIEFAPLKEQDAMEWICDRAAHFGKKLDTRGAKMLVDLLGTDLRQLSSELEKLVTYVGSEEAITTADVEATIGVSPQYNVFELNKAIGIRNKTLASEIVVRMFEADKKALFMTLFNLAKYFEQLVVAREMSHNRESDQAIAKALDLYGGAVFYVKNYVAEARRYTAIELDNAIKAIVATEYQTRKTSMVDDCLLVQQLIAEIL